MKFKRKKNVKQRGSKTYGWGAKKKHRGAGHRGGKGMAGTGKRGDANNPSINKETYFGKHGFISKSRKKVKALNIDKLQKNLKDYVAKGLVNIKNDVYVVNLKDLGYTKLLGKGKVIYKFEITSDFASANVKEKIEQAKGKLTLIKKGKGNKKGKSGKREAKKGRKIEEELDEEETEDDFEESDEEEE
jgi:large subunit ribosomal protein L15